MVSKTRLSHGARFLPGVLERSALLENDQASMSIVASGTMEALPQGLDGGKEAPLTSPSTTRLLPRWTRAMRESV